MINYTDSTTYEGMISLHEKLLQYNNRENEKYKEKKKTSDRTADHALYTFLRFSFRLQQKVHPGSISYAFCGSIEGAKMKKFFCTAAARRCVQKWNERLLLG